MAIDYVNCTISIDLDYYPQGNESSQRVSAQINFSGVRKLNEVSDFDELSTNASAGNITYWVPAKNNGTSYIYLARGFISIEAAGVEVVQVAA